MHCWSRLCRSHSEARHAVVRSGIIQIGVVHEVVEIGSNVQPGRFVHQRYYVPEKGS
jgi:hypothetical protein